MTAIVFFESADSSRADCLRFSRTTDPIIARDCRGSYDFAIFFFFLTSNAFYLSIEVTMSVPFRDAVSCFRKNALRAVSERKLLK
jgi:hypothetical protein